MFRRQRKREKKTVILSIRLTPSQYRLLKEYCSDEPIGAFIRRLLSDWIQQEPKRKTIFDKLFE
jgi:hypothetical protein